MILVRNGHVSKPVHLPASSAKPELHPAANTMSEAEIVRRLLAHRGMKLSVEAPPEPAAVNVGNQSIGKQGDAKTTPFIIPATRFRPPEKISLWQKMFGPPARPSRFSFEEFVQNYVRNEWMIGWRKDAFTEMPEKIVTTIPVGLLSQKKAWPYSQSSVGAAVEIGASGTVYVCVSRREMKYDPGFFSLLGMNQSSLRGLDRRTTWHVLKQPEVLFDKAAKAAGFP